MSASALFQEIHSYIKGSHLSLDRECGFLSREEYLFLPTKMAVLLAGSLIRYADVVHVRHFHNSDPSCAADVEGL